jgi:crotonobetainyl-CoA:carnitine CoA-transferase CaiB-like acyl-CoA transferase
MEGVVHVAALMAVQSAAGVLVPSVDRDTGCVTAAWYGNDVVTALVAVPLLVGSLLAVRRGSLRGQLVWYAMLGCAVYNYAYYLFGAAARRSAAVPSRPSTARSSARLSSDPSAVSGLPTARVSESQAAQVPTQ